MTDVRDAPWIGERQLEALRTAWGDDWATQLGERIDEERSDWADLDDDARAGWLTEYIAENLLWITATQDGHLRPLEERYGARGEWLPGTFDVVWPGWRTAEPDQLGGLLDRVIGVAYLTWISDEQAGQLDTLWEVRGDWREWLPGELDERWPQWLQADPATLGPWLDQLLPFLVVPADVVDVEDLAWLSAEQTAHLDGLAEVRGDWRSWLPRELDERWPDWRRSTPDVVGPYLDGLLPFLVLPVDAVDVEGLAWVTDEQQAVLLTMRELRGDWHDWLPRKLDAVEPNWRNMTAEELPAVLDRLLPEFVSAEDQAAAALAEGVTTEFTNNPEFAALLEGLDENDIAEVLQRAGAQAE